MDNLCLDIKVIITTYLNIKECFVLSSVSKKLSHKYEIYNKIIYKPYWDEHFIPKEIGPKSKHFEVYHRYQCLDYYNYEECDNPNHYDNVITKVYKCKFKNYKKKIRDKFWLEHKEDVIDRNSFSKGYKKSIKNRSYYFFDQLFNFLECRKVYKEIYTGFEDKKNKHDELIDEIFTLVSFDKIKIERIKEIQKTLKYTY